MKLCQQQISKLREIPIRGILEQSAAKPDRYDKNKWHTPQGTLSINGQKFINWHSAKGGGGAIDLVMHLHGLSFKQALQWLQTNHTRYTQTACSHTAKPKLLLPKEDPTKLPKVIDYLTSQRAVPSTTIKQLIAKHKLYADTHANAVFLMLGKAKDKVGAEIRATGQQRRHGMAPGTRKDKGCFYISPKRLNTYILCESAIDAISCHTLHPQSCCLSTAGVHPNPGWLIWLLEKKKPIYCGYDNDRAGELNAKKLIQAYPTVKRLAPKEKDWNLDLVAS